MLVILPQENDSEMTRTVKLAVVGTGLAGLTAAYLLKRPLQGASPDVEFEVHVFEKVRFLNVYLQCLTVIKAPSIGMDSSSISLTVPGLKEDWRVDVPMRSFQGGIHYTPPFFLMTSMTYPFVQVTTLILFRYIEVSESGSDKPISHFHFLPFFRRQTPIPGELQQLLFIMEVLAVQDSVNLRVLVAAAKI